MHTHQLLSNDPLDVALRRLLDDILRLRNQVAEGATQRLSRFESCNNEGGPTKSARNLAHYLTLRQHDLRPLQERLARLGLSSLGRSEAHVIASLGRIADLLGRAVGVPVPPIDSGPWPGIEEGPRILEDRTASLFGNSPGQRRVRIMVTLSTDTADDYSLIQSLLERGMDCARINCAHDDDAVWEAMIENIRRAEAVTGRSCKILMDLAGHKVRTGPIETAPAIRHLKVRRDSRGRVIGPAPVLLEDERLEQRRGPAPAEAKYYRLALPTRLHIRLSIGDRLQFTDARGMERQFEIVERTQTGAWVAHCHKNTYLAPSTTLSWERLGADGEYHVLGQEDLCPFSGEPVDIRLANGDSLLLTRQPAPGGAARHSESDQAAIPAHIGCSRPEIIDELQRGNPVWIDDGKLGAVVESVSEHGALLRITHARPKGTRLRNGKGLNFPETRLQLPPLTDKDLHDLDFACQHADMLGFSFVETLEDMDHLIAELVRRGASQLPVIAKIETKRAVKNLPELILGTTGKIRLGIMIARGDLAVELGGERLAEVQEEILWLCEAGHVPVVWATQVLETLTKKGIVSRPEFTDAAMAERADCVMLNKGPYVLRALKTLDDILVRMQAHQRKKSSRLRALHW